MVCPQSLIGIFSSTAFWCVDRRSWLVCAVSPHDHAWDEAYYVTQGQVRFNLAGQEQVVKAGEFIYAPGCMLHGFQGDSEDPARMLIIDAPAHAEAFFRDVDREVKVPADRAKAPEIGRRNQIFFRMG